MKKGTRAALISAVILILTLFFPRGASAHGDEPRLEITPETLNPGMVLQIRGVGFEFEEQVALALTGGPGVVPLGDAVADAEGGFMLLLTVPADLGEGMYSVHGSTDDHEVDSPQFSVRGPAALEEGGEEAREEDDGLLAPMPTYAPGASSTPMPKAGVQGERELEETIIFLAIGALALVGLLIVFGSKRRQGGSR